MSAGMLTVVGNPRRRRRNRRKKATSRRRVSRRRRTTHVARAHNPRRRRRVHARRRRSNPRRRRHHNPIVSGGILGGVTKGVFAGVGAIAARIVANGVNNLAFKGSISGPAKIGLEAAVGVVGFLGLKSLPATKKFAAPFAVGAGIIVALDLYDSYLKAMLPAMLQDYSYGALNDYQTGQLNGWAPQGDGGLSGGGVYDGGVY